MHLLLEASFVVSRMRTGRGTAEAYGWVRGAGAAEVTHCRSEELCATWQVIAEGGSVLSSVGRHDAPVFTRWPASSTFGIFFINVSPS